MPPDPQSVARLTRVLAEIQNDSAAMERLVAELRSLDARWSESMGRPELVLAAVDLHGYYTALEALLERVARAVDEELPAGPAWHAELLKQMSIAIPGIRPAVLPPDRFSQLHELRRFRHFFRNAYVLEPEPDQLRGHVGTVLDLHASIASGIEGLRQHLEAVRSKLLAD